MKKFNRYSFYFLDRPCRTSFYFLFFLTFRFRLIGFVISALLFACHLYNIVGTYDKVYNRLIDPSP